MAITEHHRPYFRGSGYWALIIGGSSGMGLAAAQKLAAEGMHICLLHRDRRKDLPAIESAFEEMRAQGVKLLALNQDALKADTITHVLQELQTQMAPNESIRLLLHALAKGNLKLLAPFPKSEDLTDSPFSQLESELAAIWKAHPQVAEPLDFQLTIEAMALNLYQWVQAVFQAKGFSADARIIGLTSEGSHKAWRYYAAVAAAKAALEVLCRSMALEFAPYGIRCNVVQAGITDTPSLRMIPGSQTMLEHAAKRNPFRRLTLTEDVANVIYLLCREEAAWINGAIIPVDGGEQNQ